MPETKIKKIKNPNGRPVFTARKHVKETHDIPAKTLANLASLGKGPPIYRVGRAIYYKTADLDALFIRGRK